MDDLSRALSSTVIRTRKDLGLSVGELAERAQVSRAMIGKIERGEAQPTAALLGRLSGALGLTLSELVARAERDGGGRLRRRADQDLWTDPVTGYERRSVSPTGSPIGLTEVDLPAGSRVAFPADSYAFTHHQIWVLRGRLDFLEGEVCHHLAAGDCLQLGPPQPCEFVNPTTKPCRYLVVLARR